jgi:hypothetical protein
MKSGNLNFLEASEPLQACNGTDLRSTAFINNGVLVISMSPFDISRYISGPQAGPKQIMWPSCGMKLASPGLYFIEIDLKAEVWERGWGVDWIGLTQDRDKWWALVNTVMNLQDAYNARNLSTSCCTSSIRFSRATLLHGFSQLVNKFNLNYS